MKDNLCFHSKVAKESEGLRCMSCDKEFNSRAELRKAQRRAREEEMRDKFGDRFSGAARKIKSKKHEEWK